MNVRIWHIRHGKWIWEDLCDIMDEVIRDLKKFQKERDWQKYHTFNWDACHYHIFH